MPRSRKFDEVLIERLRNPEEAKLYFNAVVEECQECNAKEARGLLLHALKNIAEAQGGISELAAKTKLGRPSLYKTLSPQGNPRLSTVLTITHALLFAPAHKR